MEIPASGNRNTLRLARDGPSDHSYGGRHRAAQRERRHFKTPGRGGLARRRRRNAFQTRVAIGPSTLAATREYERSAFATFSGAAHAPRGGGTTQPRYA